MNNPAIIEVVEDTTKEEVVDRTVVEDVDQIKEVPNIWDSWGGVP